MQLEWAGRNELIEAIDVLKSANPAMYHAIIRMGDNLANQGVEPKGIMMRLVPAFMHISAVVRFAMTDDATVTWELVNAIALGAGYEL